MVVCAESCYTRLPNATIPLVRNRMTLLKASPDFAQNRAPDSATTEQTLPHAGEVSGEPAKAAQYRCEQIMKAIEVIGRFALPMRYPGISNFGNGAQGRLPS